MSLIQRGKPGDGEDGNLWMSGKRGKESNYFVSENGIHLGDGRGGGGCKLEYSEVLQPFE